MAASTRSARKSKVKLSDVQGNILHGFDKAHVRLIFFSFGIDVREDNKVKDLKAENVMRWLGDVASRDVLASTVEIIDSSKRLQQKRLKDPNWLPQELWLHISLSALGISKLRVGKKYLPIPPSTGVYRDIGLDTTVKPARSPGAADLFPKDALFPVSESWDPFLAGMKSRKEKLGDNGDSDPKNWDPTYRVGEPDALFIVAADEEDDLDIFVVKLIAEAEHEGIGCVGLERGQALFNEQGKQVEHFGFRDGVSQPLIKGVDDHKIKMRNFYKDIFYPEDFVLFGLSQELRWANNGSFLVFRKLEQNVQAFWDFMKKSREENMVDDPPEQLGTKIVGRWKSGAPLALFPSYDPVDPADSDKNDFVYVGRKVLTTPLDVDGKDTPLFSHARITNPRDMSPDGPFLDPQANIRENARHRMLRRAIPYGPKWSADRIAKNLPKRGLLFLCYQRDIAEQFEEIQIRLAKYSAPHYGQSPHAKIEALMPEGYKHLMEKWIITKGGGYFFSPSISALRDLKGCLV